MAFNRIPTWNWKLPEKDVFFRLMVAFVKEGPSKNAVFASDNGSFEPTAYISMYLRPISVGVGRALFLGAQLRLRIHTFSGLKIH
jgi:hypothetical protein